MTSQAYRPPSVPRTRVVAGRTFLPAGAAQNFREIRLRHLRLAAGLPSCLLPRGRREARHVPSRLRTLHCKWAPTQPQMVLAAPTPTSRVNMIRLRDGRLEVACRLLTTPKSVTVCWCSSCAVVAVCSPNSRSRHVLISTLLRTSRDECYRSAQSSVEAPQAPARALRKSKSLSSTTATRFVEAPNSF